VVGYRRADGVLSEVLDGRAMLVAADGTELITLNPTGTAVWDALADASEPSAIAARLHEAQSNVALDVLEADVRAFLTELEEAALVVAE
jgi:Coenzyme PQQ synthesis protein D (PqqD)